MRYVDSCTRMLLTVVAILLVWNMVMQFRSARVHAESTQYGVEVVTAKLPWPLRTWGSGQYSSELAASLNNAAKGRELVTLIRLEPSDKYVAVFKEARHR